MHAPRVVFVFVVLGVLVCAGSAAAYDFPIEPGEPTDNPFVLKPSPFFTSNMPLIDPPPDFYSQMPVYPGEPSERRGPHFEFDRPMTVVVETEDPDVLYVVRVLRRANRPNEPCDEFF